MSLDAFLAFLIALFTAVSCLDIGIVESGLHGADSLTPNSKRRRNYHNIAGRTMVVNGLVSITAFILTLRLMEIS